MRVFITAALGVIAFTACEGRTRSAGVDSARGDTRSTTALEASCYRSPTSIMGRTSPLSGHSTVAPGWLRVDEHSSADSGTVRLIDSDGAAFVANWRRIAPDSIRVYGRDDFMEITINARVRDGSVEGRGLITSDADVQRNAAGQLEPLRREWAVAARQESCDAVPADSLRRD